MFSCSWKEKCISLEQTITTSAPIYLRLHKKIAVKVNLVGAHGRCPPPRSAAFSTPGHQHWIPSALESLYPLVLIFVFRTANDSAKHRWKSSSAKIAQLVLVQATQRLKRMTKNRQVPHQTQRTIASLTGRFQVKLLPLVTVVLASLRSVWSHNLIANH